MPDVETSYYIAPNSTIHVLKGIPLEKNYEHTIGWGTVGDVRARQAQYFISHRKYTFEKNYYQRVSRGWIRVGRPSNVTPGNALESKEFLCADDFYDCNYIMFRNDSFSNKWFYAFITAVNYINDNTTEIQYEIDVMQTWLEGTSLDYIYGNCYIERQHNPTDDLYDNLVPESLDLGDEYVNTQISYYAMNDCVIMFVLNNAYATDINYTYYTDNYIGNDSGGFIMNNVYGNAAILWFSVTQSGINKANELMEKFITKGKEQDIINIFMVPKKFLKNKYKTESFVEIVKPVKAPTKGSKLGMITLGDINSGRNTYTPKNAKLYSYPYSRLLVSNQNGGSREYKWELFNNTQNRGTFKIVGSVAWTPSATAIPLDYRGFGALDRENYTVENIDDAVTFEDFPICAWSGDAFKAWWAQNANSKGASIVSSLMALSVAAAGFATGGIPGIVAGASALSGGTALLKTFGSITDAKQLPDHSYGNFSKANTNAAIRNIGFVFASQSLRPEVLKVADDFFTRYGYAQKTNGFPDVYARKHWTYIKTAGMNIEGNLNAEDTKKICDIFDNGITFWSNPNEIGNYSLNNSPKA